MKKLNKDIYAFIIATFVFSWVLWLPFVLEYFNVIEMPESVVSLTSLAVMIGAFGPMVGAIYVVKRKNGWSGVKAFFKEKLNFKSKYRYYFLAIIIPVVLTIAVNLAVNFFGIDNLPDTLIPADIGNLVYFFIVPYFVLMLVVGGGQEEFGWRGYLQDALEDEIGFVKSVISVGIVWALWHLPVFAMTADGHQYYSFFAFLIFALGLAMIVGVLYKASGKKMVIAWVFHGASNTIIPFFPILHLQKVPQPGYWIYAGVNLIVGIIMLVIYTKKQKSHKLEEKLNEK